MGDLHFHVTSFLSEDADKIARFREAAEQHFQHVWPLPPGGENVLAFALYSKDFDGISDALAMPDVVEALTGILDHDIEIVSAWDSCRLDDGGERGSVWRIKGASPA